MNREYIGLDDKDGNQIHVGDVVEFYFDTIHGPSAEPLPGSILMKCVIIKTDGKYFFWLPQTVAFAWRFAEYCTIIGQDPGLVDT